MVRCTSASPAARLPPARAPRRVPPRRPGVFRSGGGSCSLSATLGADPGASGTQEWRFPADFVGSARRKALAPFYAGAKLTVSAQTSLPPQHSQDAFGFIQSLASELSAGKVDLPSFPEIAVRVRRILSDPNSSVEQVVRVVGSEPALSARLLRIANSTSLNRSGKAVTDLRTAINRIGDHIGGRRPVSLPPAA